MTSIPEPLFMAQPEELDVMRVAASVYQSRGAFAEMEGVLAGLAVLEPGDPWIYGSLGFARHRQGKLKEAATAYERAIELSGAADNVSAVNLIAVYLLLARGEEAISQLRRVIDSGDRRPVIRAAIEQLGAAFKEAGSSSSEK